MTLFLCRWPDAPAFLVDVPDEARARAAAVDHAVGEAPVEILELPPGVFAAELVWDQTTADPGGAELETMVLDLYDHTYEALEALDDKPFDAAPIDVVADTYPAPATFTPCPAIAEGDGGAEYPCELDAGHAPPHSALGGRATWESP